MSAHRLEQTTFIVTCASGLETKAKGELRWEIRDARFERLFMRGNLILTTDLDLPSAWQILAAAETDTLGKIVPVQVRCEIPAGSDAPASIAEASDLLPGPSRDMTFKAVCHRRGNQCWDSGDVVMAVGLRCAERTGSEPDLHGPEQLVCLEAYQDTIYLGVMRADQLIRKTITKSRKWAPGERPVSRAENKLREAFEQFRITLPAGARALDIGSAPGGWARVLCEHADEVVAVDPGELDARVFPLENVRHLAIRSEKLTEVPDLGCFDILTNDMNTDPDVSARIMCDLANLLNPGAICVMTVKFVSRAGRVHVQEALDILAECFTDLEVGRVPHNMKETTIVGRLRPA